MISATNVAVLHISAYGSCSHCLQILLVFPSVLGVEGGGGSKPPLGGFELLESLQ